MNVTVFEEHSSVLPHWAETGVERATVVYLDAHLDLQFVDAERIERLRQCRRTGSLRALESTHPFACPDGACFGIEDFLYPAAQLGLIERVVWVAPPHVMRAGLGASIGKLVQMEGVTLDDIESFDVQPGGYSSGRLMGVDLTICALEQLDRIELPEKWLLDIDVDYFVTLPESRLGVDPRTAIARLRALPAAPQSVTISRSVGTGFTPLRYRFLGELLASLWAGKGPTAAPIERVLQAEQLLASGDREACRTLCAALVAEQPGLAAAWYLAGLSADSALAAGQFFKTAVLVDSAFDDDVPLEIANAHSRKLRIDMATLARWHRALSHCGEAAPERAGPAWVMLGLLYCSAGLMVQACDADDRALQIGNGHPELALEIANGFLARRDVRSARRYLPRAIAHSSSRARAYLLAARADEAEADAGGACAWLRKAAEALPANPTALQMLSRANGTAGNPDAAAATAQQAQALAGRLDRVARRLVATAT